MDRQLKNKILRFSGLAWLLVYFFGAMFLQLVHPYAESHAAKDAHDLVAYLLENLMVFLPVFCLWLSFAGNPTTRGETFMYWAWGSVMCVSVIAFIAAAMGLSNQDLAYVWGMVGGVGGWVLLLWRKNQEW